MSFNIKESKYIRKFRPPRWSYNYCIPAKHIPQFRWKSNLREIIVVCFGKIHVVAGMSEHKSNHVTIINQSDGFSQNKV